MRWANQAIAEGAQAEEGPRGGCLFISQFVNHQLKISAIYRKRKQILTFNLKVTI